MPAAMCFVCGMVLTNEPTAVVWYLQVELFGQCPPIVKLDAALGTLKACKCEIRCARCGLAALSIWQTLQCI